MNERITCAQSDHGSEWIVNYLPKLVTAGTILRKVALHRKKPT
jgi:hypothetical protein